MISLNDFINSTISQIKVGIDSFNKSSHAYKAEYPKTIELEINIIPEGDLMFVVPYKTVNRARITINIEEERITHWMPPQENI